MKKNLFLQGDIGVGKSSLIRKNLLSHFPKVGGIYVQRIYIGNSYVAFKLNPLENAEDYQLNLYVTSIDKMDDLFLYSDQQGKWYKNLEVFNTKAITYLKKSMTKKIILLDELGELELNCTAYLKAVLDVLEGDVPAIGVIKSSKNAKKVRAALPEKHKDSNETPLNYIKSHPQVELLNVTKHNLEIINNRVKSFVEEAVL